MAAQGCWLVPTLTILQDIQRWAADGKLTPAAAARVRELAPRFGQSVKIALPMGQRRLKIVELETVHDLAEKRG